MQTVLITGGTGLVGKALGQALLKKGYSVIILSRDAAKESNIANLSYTSWNVAAQKIDERAVANADYIIHLAGAGVADKRWTKKRKQEIIDSRVQSSKLLVDSLKNIPNKVKAVVSASAIGWYGADAAIPNPQPFTEYDPADEAFLGITCRQWEESITPVAETGRRLVKLRIGIVLSKEGGALKEFLKPLQFGVATILGSGKQMISWIHIDDMVQLFVAAIENENMRGVYNAVAPNPVSNKELIIQLAKARNKFYVPMSVPAFVLKIMLGEMSIEILKSATVSAEKTIGAGFVFSYPLLKPALTDLCKR
jgi:uncharacterized protein